ncbi:Triacylglycerol lipase [Bertholletia excelsa]
MVFMSKCFSFTAWKNSCYRSFFSQSGLRSTISDFGDGTVMHCWVPKMRSETKPDLVLIHGFGANAMWQWGEILRPLISHFNVYVPDLIFFGESYTTRPEWSEEFQAWCVMRVVRAHWAGRVSLAGLSYGGFVAYSMAAQFPESVARVVLCAAGVGLEERDLVEGMFPVADLEEVAKILLPQTVEKMRELMKYTLVRPPLVLPSCFLQDYIDATFTEYVEEKKELIRAIPKNRKLSNLPKITQPTLIIWGDQDRVFPLELGYRLKRHLGESAQLQVIKDTGHALNVEKPKDLYKHIKAFLADPLPSSSKPSSQSFQPQMT